MSDRYFGKVVHISDKYSVVINVGEDGLSKIGTKLLIVGLGDLIKDPDTQEELERLEIVRGRAEVIHVQAKLSTIKSIEFDQRPDTREIKKVTSRGGGIAALMGPQDVVTESITPSGVVLLELRGVKVGDFVIKL